MQRWITRFEQMGSIEQKARSGRPKLLTFEQEEEILDKFRTNPFLKVAEVARDYLADPKILRKLLKRNGIKCSIAARKIALTENHRLNRLAFCTTCLDEYDDNDWKKIIFTDEKIFCTNSLQQRLVYRPVNSRYLEQFVQPTNMSGRRSLCFWGAISYEGPWSPLVVIKENFNARRYIRLLSAYVTPKLQGDLIFMHDNSPVHTAQIVGEYITKKNYVVLEWPPKSPDINPIENVWALMARNWPDMPDRTNEALIAECTDRWNELYDRAGNSRSLSKNFDYVKITKSLMDKFDKFLASKVIID